MPRNPDGSAFRPERGTVIDLQVKPVIDFALDCEERMRKAAKESGMTIQEINLGCLAATFAVVSSDCELGKEDFGENSREYALSFLAKAYFKDLLFSCSKELMVTEVN